MGPFLPLFSIELEHGFFSDGLWRDLRFVPAPATQALIDRAGMVIRKTPNGFELYHDRSRTEALKFFLADADGEFSFGFKFHVDDEGFKIYSEAFAGDKDVLPYFDSEHGVPDGDRIRLHRKIQVSEKDMRPIESEALSGLLSRRDRLMRPAFALRIVFRPARRKSLEKSLETEPPRYFLRFGPRQTHWAYYLLGSFAGKRASIVDLDDGIDFEPLDRVSLADRRSALAFRSKVAIPLRQHSECRFQLREAGSSRGRILVRRLPVAGARQLNRHIVKGKVVSVSEIYVND